MQAVFLIIVSILAAGYALITRQAKIALGLLVVAISFVFAIPGLVSGVWVDIFGALVLIIFAVGMILIVYPKKGVKAIKDVEDIEVVEDKEKK